MKLTLSHCSDYGVLHDSGKYDHREILFPKAFAENHNQLNEYCLSLLIVCLCYFTSSNLISHFLVLIARGESDTQNRGDK
jgi:hypothetical protein